MIITLVFGIAQGRGGLCCWLDDGILSKCILFLLRFAKWFSVLCVLFDVALLQSPHHLQILLIMILFFFFVVVPIIDLKC